MRFCILITWFLASSGKVTLTNPEDNIAKDYFYDFWFWSHDNKQGRKLFTNSDLYDKIGTELLSNAYSGFNSTVFAYGQTGSGKSYSIEGSKDDKGLLQRVWEALFDKKTEIEKTEGNSLDVYVSYLEIYNENLRDLLDCTEKRIKNFPAQQYCICQESFENLLWWLWRYIQIIRWWKEDESSWSYINE